MTPGRRPRCGGTLILGCGGLWASPGRVDTPCMRQRRSCVLHGDRLASNRQALTSRRRTWRPHFLAIPLPAHRLNETQIGERFAVVMGSVAGSEPAGGAAGCGGEAGTAWSNQRVLLERFSGGRHGSPHRLQPDLPALAASVVAHRWSPDHPHRTRDRDVWIPSSPTSTHRSPTRVPPPQSTFFCSTT